MDVSLSPFVALLLAGLLSIFIFATRNRKPSPPSSGHGRRLPPSPPGVPVLGHLPLLGSLPHRKLRSWAEVHGPVMLLHLGHVPTVVASSAAAAQEAMKTRDLVFASRPPARMAERLLYGRDMAFAPYGEYWRQARRICVLHLLSQRRVQSFRPAREQEVAALLDRVRHRSRANGGGVVNLSELLVSYANGVISRAAFGNVDGSGVGGGKLKKLLADFVGLLGVITVGEFVPWLAWVDKLMGLDAKATATFEALDSLLERVIKDHRKRRRDGRFCNDKDHRDFVDVLLDVSEEEEKTGGGVVHFDTTAIKALILDMFAASIDTTYNTLEWAMAELVKHPHEMCRVQAEIRAAVDNGQVTEDCHGKKVPYLKCVIKETLRLHAPIPLLVPRETLEDTELLGYHVPARTRVIINVWAIGRDPAAWERADEFVPERFAGRPAESYVLGQDFNFVPFGAGRRGCPGVEFALPSLELVLASLLYHFDWELPAGGGASTLDMTELYGLSVRRKAPLHLVAKPWFP